MKWPCERIPRWSDPPIGRWHRAFALLPQIIGDEWVWLEWYWVRTRAGGYFHERTQQKPEGR